MIAIAPVLAAGEGQIIITVIIVLVTIVAHIAQTMGKWRKLPAPPNRPNVRPNPARPGPAGAKDPLADEIGEFLRRASARRPQAGPQPGRAVGAPPSARAQEIRAQGPKPARPEQPVPAIVVEGKPDASVAQHVEQRMKTTFKRLGPDLTTEVDQADEKIESHLHQVFDHGVGRLSAVPGETAKPTAADQPEQSMLLGGGASLAEAVVGIFANPATVPQAILIHEILRRPEERWG